MVKYGGISVCVLVFVSTNKISPAQWGSCAGLENSIKGSGRHSTLQGWEQSVFNKANIGTVSKATFGETAERQGGARMGLSERYAAILSWNWNWNCICVPKSVEAWMLWLWRTCCLVSPLSCYDTAWQESWWSEKFYRNVRISICRHVLMAPSVWKDEHFGCEELAVQWVCYPVMAENSKRWINWSTLKFCFLCLCPLVCGRVDSGSPYRRNAPAAEHRRHGRRWERGQLHWAWTRLRTGGGSGGRCVYFCSAFLFFQFFFFFIHLIIIWVYVMSRVCLSVHLVWWKL